MATESKRTEYIFAVAAIFFLSGALTPLMQSSSMADAELTDGDIWMQLQWLVLYFFTFLFLFRNNFSDKIKFLFHEKWIVALLLTAFFSFIWAEFPTITLRRSMGIIGSTFFGYYLAIRFTLSKSLKIMTTGLLISLIASLAYRFIAPGTALMQGEHEGLLRGIFVHKNIIGRVTLIFALLVSSRFMAKDISFSWYASYMILSLIIILMSGSFTALAVLIIIHLILYVYFVAKKIKITKSTIIYLTLFILIPFGYIFFSILPDILDYFGRDLTLTGRTVMWVELIGMIQERFLLGYGYGSFWLGDIGPSGYIYSIIPWAAPHAHNGFIELFLNGGLILFLLFIFSFFVNVKRVKNVDSKLKRSLTYFSISYLSFYLIYNFSESLIMVQNNIFWVVYVFITISLYAWQKKEVTLQLT